MCGIVGIYDFKNGAVKEDDIVKMTDILKHRGPDGEGFYVKKNIGLGHRRLSIIDLSDSAQQPMKNEDGSLLITYNGEIYNYLDLKKKLIKLGHVFQSNSDTEVLLHLFEEYGEKCLEKIKGVYAFAIWNEKSKKLFLARDKFGTKPLYYAILKNKFIFASEVKAILTVKGAKREICYEALNEYFTFQNIYSQRTLLKDIKILQGGHKMTVDKEGKINVSQFWDYKIEEDYKLSENDYKEEIRKTFDASISRHLLSDVPVGSYASGGMDSSSIIAVASQKIPHMMTFTGGFDISKAFGIELIFDERKDAEIVSRTFDTEHYEMVIHAGDMARIMPQLIWHLEDLRVGMCYQNYYIAQLASKFVKVVLSGGGGDEMFGGYPWRYDIALKSKNDNEFNKKYYKYWNRLIKDEDKKEFFSESVFKKINNHSTYDEYRKVIGKADNLSFLNRVLYFEAKTFLHGLCIVEDKVSFANSLESRVPFLDDDLVELARKLPAKYKYKNGQGKYLLRKSLNYLLPKEIVKKKKQGFSTPDGSWYRGPSIDYIKSTLLDKKAINRGYFNPEHIKRILKEHSLGKINHRLLIWSLLSFEWWNRIFIDNELNKF